MRIRVINWEGEVIGSAEKPKHENDYVSADAVLGRLQCEDRSRYIYTTVPWWIDDEGSLIAEALNGIEAASTRMEFFLKTTEEGAPYLPGWERLPPKRIIDLSTLGGVE